MEPYTQLATDFMGTKIKIPTGEDVGVIQNLLVDPPNGTLIYVVLCYAGFLGKAHRHFAIHPQKFTVKYADRGSLFLEISKKALINAGNIPFNGFSSKLFESDDTQVYELLST